MKKSLILPLILAFFACNQAGTATKDEEAAYDPAATKAEINSTYQQFEQSMAKGDSAGVVALYHPDAKVYPPNAEAGGRSIMGSLSIGGVKMGLKSIRINSGEVSGGPDEVIETGTFEVSDSARVVDKGKYIVIWKKDGDKWKIYRDIWNSDKPVAKVK